MSVIHWMRSTLYTWCYCGEILYNPTDITDELKGNGQSSVFLSICSCFIYDMIAMARILNESNSFGHNLWKMIIL